MIVMPVAGIEVAEEESADYDVRSAVTISAGLSIERRSVMRRQQLCQVLSLFALVHLAGCLPATGSLVPALRGRVVDSMGQPVSGAKVTVAPVDPTVEIRSFAISTDRQGRFRRGEQAQWFLAILVPTDVIAPEFEATATRGEARSTPKRFGGGLIHPQYLGITNKRRTFDLGDLVVPTPSGVR